MLVRTAVNTALPFSWDTNQHEIFMYLTTLPRPQLPIYLHNTYAVVMSLALCKVSKRPWLEIIESLLVFPLWSFTVK